MEQTVSLTGSTALVEGTSAGGIPAPRLDTAPAKPQRALTADFVRVMLFTGVVVAHGVNAVNTTPDVVRSANLVGTLLHLTRYGFVAVTLFVLVLSMRGRTMSPMTFWRRRFGLIVVPYLAWTVIYAITDHLVIAGNPFPGAGRFFTDLGLDTLSGEGKYQLYFLLISMQIYLAFPALAWLMRRTAHRPWLVLSAAGAVQLAMFVVYQYLPRPGGQVWHQVYENLWKTLPMYALFIAIGMLAAHHHRALEEWLRAHIAPVITCCLLGTAFSIGAYTLSTSSGNVPLQSNTPWNPLYLPWLLSGLVALWLIAMAWDGMRQSGLAVGAQAVSYATIRAFGVFAVHPLLLDIEARLGFFDLLNRWLPTSPALRTTILVVLTLAASLIVVDLILRTPVSRWIVARDPVARPWRRISRRRTSPAAGFTTPAGGYPSGHAP